MQTTPDNVIAQPRALLRYRNDNAGHDIPVKLLCPLMGRQWMCEVIKGGSRFPVGERLLINLDDLRKLESEK